MGRASVRENKNIYQRSRESCALTRAQASEKMVWVTESRIEKIEADKTVPTPEEALAMATAYNKASLCNHYCSRECAIGRKYVPEAHEKPVEAIVLELLASLNVLEKDRDRLIEITSDGAIHDDQIRDFVRIRDELNRTAAIIHSLAYWFDDTVQSGGINRDILRAVTGE